MRENGLFLRICIQVFYTLYGQQIAEICLYKFVDAVLRKFSEKKLWEKNLEERCKNGKFEKNSSY